MADQNNDSKNVEQSKYGKDWVPTPDDPNYEAYLKYQSNLNKATGKASSVNSSGQSAAGAARANQPAADASQAGQPSAQSGSEGAPSGQPTNQGSEKPVNPNRPHQENPDAKASDYMGPLYKPSHWSDKPNPNAPWWANPYTYVDKGEWRKPNWGFNDEEPNVAAGQSNTAAEQPADDVTPSTTKEESSVQPGAWVLTGDAASPWAWDAAAVPNQQIDGKPCKLAPGAWVPSGNPASPWAWDATVLPTEFREGKPVHMPQQASAAGVGTGGGSPVDGQVEAQGGSAQPSAQQPGQTSSQQGQQPRFVFPDQSQESGENRPDVPMGTRVGWFFIGLIGGFIGLVIAWMVGSRYPRKQRNQVVRWCWAGFFVWCLLMFAIMGMNGTGTNPFATSSGSSTSTGSTSAFSSAAGNFLGRWF